MCQVSVGPERVRGLRMYLVRGGKDAFAGSPAPGQSFPKVPALTRNNINTLSHSCQGGKDYKKMLFIMVTFLEWGFFQKSKQFIEASRTPGFSGPSKEQGSREGCGDRTPGRWSLGLGSSSATEQLRDLEQIV